MKNVEPFAEAAVVFISSMSWLTRDRSIDRYRKKVGGEVRTEEEIKRLQFKHLFYLYTTRSS